MCLSYPGMCACLILFQCTYRQLPALDSTVGRSKVEVVADRLLDINPDLDLTPINRFLDPASAASLFSGGGESPSQAPSSAGDSYNGRSESDRGTATSSDKGASQERNPPVSRDYPPVARDCKPYDYVIDCIGASIMICVIHERSVGRYLTCLLDELNRPMLLLSSQIV